MPETISLSRPKRWDYPFSEESNPPRPFTDTEIDALLDMAPFNEMDASGFRKSLSLRDILKNDTRRVTCQSGDIIVRRGDWGHSAFLVLSGQVRVDIERPESSFPPSLLGRKSPQRRTLFESIAQVWKNPPAPESRTVSHDVDPRIGSRNKDGETRIFLQDVPSVLDEYRTAVIQPGQWFGELAALGRTPRTATVFSEGQTELLEIRWQGLRDLMRYDKNKAITNEVESAFRERALVEFLRNEPMFHGLSDQKMEQLVENVEFRTYGEYDSPKPFKDLAKQGHENNFENEALIFEEGHYPNAVFFVRSGLARLSVKHHHGQRTAGYLTPGQSYGFHEIASGWGKEVAVPYRYSVRAISYLSAILIPTHIVETVLFDSQTSFNPDHSNFDSQSFVPFTSEEEMAVPDQLVDFLVENRFIQGTETMVIDLDRCVRCDDCVRACATAHDNNPRFVRHGPVHGHHMFANACLHCADPVCMVECPTGAIYRDFGAGHVVISENSCIGCAQCANNCPYDAIRMVQITDQQGHVIVDEKNQRPLTQATKCDLCIEQLGGPACQNACSHDALFRVNMNDSQTLNDVFVR